MSIRESREMYLEVIYNLGKDNTPVKSVDIANALGYTKPSVSKAIGVLKKAGYILHSPYGDVVLTDEGKKKAERICHAHNLLTDFLVKSLNVNKEIAEENACKMEHVVTDELLDYISTYMNE